MDESDPYDENQVVNFIAIKFVQPCDGQDIKLSAPLQRPCFRPLNAVHNNLFR